MKTTKSWIWVFGILVTTVAVVINRRTGDVLTVHLVDESKKPVSASVTVQETRRYPILGSMKFLPPWAQVSTRTSKLDVIDGILKVRRIKAHGDETLLMIRARRQPSEFVVFLVGGTNGATFWRWPERGREGSVRIKPDWTGFSVTLHNQGGERERIKPEQTEISVVLD